jgi:hypothetical protein
MVPGLKFSITISAPRGEFAAACESFGAFEIDRQTFLAAVQADKIGGVRALERRSPRAPNVALAGILDFDDIGAVRCHQHGAVGTGQCVGEIKNGDAVQRRS